jgi:hypothetical protein
MYHYRLEQKDEQGLLVQYMESGGTFETAKEARQALDSITDELSSQTDPKMILNALDEARDAFAGIQYEWDMSNGRRGVDCTAYIMSITKAIHESRAQIDI